MTSVRRFLSFLLAAALISTSVPFAAFGESGKQKNDNKVQETIEELASQFQDDSRDPFGYTTDEAKMKLRSSYPEKFDLRNVDTDNDGKPDTSYVTPVKFQNPFGSCWGFAAIAAAETSILSNPELNNGLYSTSMTQTGSTDGKDADGKEILDLSEKHLVYFAATAINDKNNSQNGEGAHYLAEDEGLTITASDKLNLGGLPFFATSLFSSGMGPNLTTRKYPVSSGKDGEMTDILSYRGKKGEVQKQKVNGKWTNVCYSDEDDWAIDEQYRFLQSYKLKESYMLPTPAVVNDAKEYTYNPAGTEAIKEQLISNRAVQIGFSADTSRPDQNNEAAFMNYKTWAQYNDDARYMANHAVTVVGWDDNFSRYDFVDGKVPEGDGAWLIKNSWGSEEEQFPNRGANEWGLLNEKGEHTGYFWLSYYDHTISMPEALDFDRSNVGSEYYIDQYDYMPVSQANSGVTETELHTANIFQAEEAEELDQVSCQTAVPGTKVTYDVYLLCDYFMDPQDGVKVASVSETYDFGGFHKIDLPDNVFLQKGQNYSIVITQVAPDGKYAYSMQYGASKELAIFSNSKTWDKGVINRDESFVCIDGQWMDISDSDLKKQFAGDEAELLSFDNFPIKGYCKKVESDTVIRILGADVLSLLPVNNSLNLKLRFLGSSKDFDGDPEISWEVPEGYQDIISVEPQDDSSSCDTAKVTAKSYGKGFVLAKVKGYGTTVVKIFVMQHELMGCEFKDENPVYVYTGKPITPEITPVCLYGCTDLVEGRDYTIKYKDNINAGTATVQVTGIGNYQSTAENTFEILKAKNRMKASSRKVRVKASDLRKKAVKVKRSKAIKIKKADGKVRYRKLKGSKKITVSKKTGKIKLSKGLKKGTYKIKVKVRARGTKNYKAKTKILTIKIKVK